ncbi:MAG TPA: hypothetical protein VMV69_25010 [Pirellulales bacterium]|nr:hypothetical protein [Pirellulales bacterium]
MAKPLVFQFGDCDWPFTMNKVDRSRLYGYKEVEALDDHGRRCELATLTADGRTVVGRGGTAFGQIAPDGTWRDKGQLRPIDVDGNEIQSVPSSFGAPIKLFDVATVDEYLKHNIRLVYQMSREGDPADGDLAAELARGTIFKFPYSYRGGLEADAGFLLQGDDGNTFLAVGNPTKVEFIGLREMAVLEEEGEFDETELMDFDMI